MVDKKIEHIAKLANLKVVDKEKMEKQFKDILTEIDKILSLEVDTDIMYTSSDNKNCYNSDTYIESIDAEEMFKNSKMKCENYIKVPKVIE